MSASCAIKGFGKRPIYKNTKPLIARPLRISAVCVTKLSAIFLISIPIWLLTVMSGKTITKKIY